MYDVSLLVDHDVAIVPVLDLKQVAHQGVGSHTLDEVSTSLSEYRYHINNKMSGKMSGKDERERVRKREGGERSIHLLKLDRLLFSVDNLEVL